MPAFENLRDTLRKHSGKILSGIGAALVTPLLARIASRWTGRVVDRLWGEPEGDGADPAAGEGSNGGATTEEEQPTEEVRPARHNYEELTKRELYSLAQDFDIHGRSRMNKAELIEALREHHAEDS